MKHGKNGIAWLFAALLATGCSTQTEVEAAASAEASTSGDEAAAPASPPRLVVPTDAMDMVPGRMEFVVRLDHSTLRDSGFEEAMISALHAEVDEDERPAVEYMLSQTDGLLVAVDVNAMESNSERGWMAVITGRYSGWSMLLQLAGRGDQELRYTHGFVDLSDDDDVAALVLDDAHLLIAPAPLVSELLDTARDPVTLAERTQAFDVLAEEMGFGAHTLDMVAVAPDELVDEISSGSGGGMGQMIAGPARDIVGLTASLDVSDQIHLVAGLHFIQEQSAIDASALGRMILAMGAQRADDPRIRELLSILQLRVDGVRLVLDGSMETERFITLVRELVEEEQGRDGAIVEAEAQAQATSAN